MSDLPQPSLPCPRCSQLETELARLRARIEELERGQKRQTAPFSKGDPKPDPKKPGRKPGENYGNKGHRQPPSQIDETHNTPCPKSCPHCGGEVEPEGIDTQYQDEVVRNYIRRRFQNGYGRCKRCRRTVRGRHPLQTSTATGAAAAQVGSDAQAMIVQMNKELGASHQKISRFFKSSFGFSITRGGVTQIIMRAAVRCGPAYRDILIFVRQSDEVYGDETGWKVSGVLHWLWGFVTRMATAYLIRPSRGADVPEEVLGPDYDGFFGHDGWAPYDSFKRAIHGTCNTHLLGRCRNLLKIATAGAVRFPRAVKAILQAGLALRDRRDEGLISPHGVAVARGRLESRLERILSSQLTHPGNVKLANHMARHFDQIFTYLRIPGVEATNWMGEQAMRPAVVNRKVWGGNRTPQGAIAQSCLTSVLRTCFQQGLDGLDFISRTLRAPPGQGPKILAAHSLA
jgi:transposase